MLNWKTRNSNFIRWAMMHKWFSVIISFVARFSINLLSKCFFPFQVSFLVIVQVFLWFYPLTMFLQEREKYEIWSISPQAVCTVDYIGVLFSILSHTTKHWNSCIYLGMASFSLSYLAWFYLRWIAVGFRQAMF